MNKKVILILGILVVIIFAIFLYNINNSSNVSLAINDETLNINYQENNNLTLPENIKSDKMNPKEVEDYWDEFKDVLTENTIFKEVIEYLQDLDVLERG